MSHPPGVLDADPVALATLATECVEHGSDLRDTVTGARLVIVVPPTAFGNSPGAESLGNAYDRLIDACGLAMEGMADVVESDADKVLGMAFAFRQQDEANAANVRDAGAV
ncbi:MAG TPA: hypothetical protein VE172_07085 [Stackebrandtia sp.]|uniref:hypothetical protein n=1 Tax=Stackebrandtia sp. TaxID=2023065 RepID=UPI002D520361|nr:hypothetical protein [Stackebrandtia sp.]HZE38564.1 hypothetical protein [Stackebrandtia sp.]